MQRIASIALHPLILGVLCVHSPAQAQMYKRINQQGSVVYTNVPSADTQGIPPFSKTAPPVKRTSQSSQVSQAVRSWQAELDKALGALAQAQLALQEFDARHGDVANHKHLAAQRDTLNADIETHQNNIKLLRESLYEANAK